MAKITPMMEQYFEIKEKYKYCILFFRLGDFYEMFFDDAIIASKELEITLTGKNWGQEERAPMCGVPFHSADTYIARLVEKGYKVAICEQVEDSKVAKGLVRRDVVRVITPGTVIDNNSLDEKKNNYIASVFCDKSGYGLSVCDVTTGEFTTTEFVSVDAINRLTDELAKFNPSEIICNDVLKNSIDGQTIEKRFSIKLNLCDNWMYAYQSANKAICRHFNIERVDGLGLKDKSFSICSSGGLFEYLNQTQKTDLNHISRINFYQTSQYMHIDISSRRNLELTETLREKKRKGSLLWILDKTKTAMGARLLKRWIEQPLVDYKEIQKRIDSVGELKENLFTREEFKDILTSMYDFERILSKIIYKTANSRDLVALKNSLENLPLFEKILKECECEYFFELSQTMDTLVDIFDLLNNAINDDDPPFTLREGGMIKEGFNNEVDTLIHAKHDGKKWIQALEDKERELSGIKNLKIKYNRIFGYYIEITNSNLKDTPDRYIRKQTLANCERYVTTELNDLAELILGAEEKLVDLEYSIFCEIRNTVADATYRIQTSAKTTAIIDVIQSLAEVAWSQNYVKPIINDSGTINIKDGRHPVVEKMLVNNDAFIPNDTYLDNTDDRLSIITGPNMAGKSTYMRQSALIVLMAQIGSFVPASYAEIGVVDRIFTRVGASDDLASGQSTFMVEMVEVANILNNATKNSLLILDEIGRGTSTFDGLSIAWAVLEYIADIKIVGAKTLFATHYHEITELEGKLEGVKNYCIIVKEQGEDIIFLRKIVRGGADNSYGIQVGKLAGLPHKVIKRSREILKRLNAADITKKAKNLAKEAQIESNKEATQVDMFNINETQLADEINKIDIMGLTPIQALQILFDLQKKTKGM